MLVDEGNALEIVVQGTFGQLYDNLDLHEIIFCDNLALDEHPVVKCFNFLIDSFVTKHYQMLSGVDCFRHAVEISPVN